MTIGASTCVATQRTSDCVCVRVCVLAVTGRQAACPSVRPSASAIVRADFVFVVALAPVSLPPRTQAQQQQPQQQAQAI